ncbi:MAG TPA: STAS domain-containing protein [Devosia sp.]|nr:STAS domain-containing protein [Devosia sp.]
MSGATSHIIELRGNLGVRDAARLAQALLQALERYAAVTVDAGALESADISILQVLAAARKSAAKAGRPLALTSGEALTRTLIKAGFLAADGSPATPEGAFWVGAEERAA